MANSFFRFKQFTIHQKHCAMKVTTDGCLFGAWVADRLAKYIMPNHTLLDIGAGTGLLSLMAVQQQPNLQVDAIEIDPLAATEASQNCLSSPWPTQIKVIQSAIQDFAATQTQQYGAIVTNPPFFEKALPSNSNSRNLAMHSHELSLAELIHCIGQLLDNNGFFAVLLPFYRTNEWLTLAHQFYVLEQVTVHQTEHHAPFRTMLLMSKHSQPSKQSTIIIKEQNKYTKDFIDLLTPYYEKL
jgi:tRNA1Val (adenine37-N6)-methyltransferase